MGKLKDLAKDLSGLVGTDIFGGDPGTLKPGPVEPDLELPAYSEEGKILVEVLTVGLTGLGYKCETEVHYHDGSTYWINEGTGFEYWFDERLEFPKPGWYMITGITGTYVRGEWGFIDDDEEWEFKEVRLATPTEIEELGP